MGGKLTIERAGVKSILLHHLQAMLKIPPARLGRLLRWTLFQPCVIPLEGSIKIVVLQINPSAIEVAPRLLRLDVDRLLKEFRSTIEAIEVVV
jgi:hypothetical protein